MPTYNPAKLFRALGDETRVRIVCLLVQQSLCVCHIVDALDEPQYKVSRHLGILKGAGLVSDRREGTWIHYSLNSELDPLARATVRAIASECAAGSFAKDRARLRESLLRRPREGCVVTERAGA